MVLCAFIVRLACALYLKTFISPEDHEYGIIARNLIAGKGFSYYWFRGAESQPSSMQAPFYPLFLALFYWIGGINSLTFLSIQAVQALLSSLTALLIYLTVNRLFNRRVALCACFLVAFYPYFIMYSLRLVPCTTILFFLALAIYFLYKTKEEPTKANQFFCGLSMAITLLSEPVVFPFFLLSLLWLMQNHSEPLSHKVRRSLLILSVMLLGMSPWLIRNFSIHHRVVFKPAFGYCLWIGNHPGATGICPIRLKQYIIQTFSEETFRELQAMSEIERERFFYNKALTFIKEHPLEFLKLSLKRVYYYWWFPPDHLVFPGPGREYSLIKKVSYGILLIFGMIGSVFSRQKWKEISLFWMLFLTLTLIYGVSLLGAQRYRMPIDLYLCVFASYTLIGLEAYLAEKRN